ncbi:MAG: hypothetical protein LBU21_04090 [Treponema sp.]|jgi:transglutaminase-like putative cysteine protease/tetratricopeptide (TPR) repeat protein|nr:hypothetical protein [Treponema sp.]
MENRAGTQPDREAESPAKTAAFILRSLALFAILFQFRLLAADLADTAVFTASLLPAFIAAWYFSKKGIPPIPSIGALLLIPWIARGFVAIPGLVSQGMAVIPDSLLLNLDRNIFVSLLPCYWAALMSYGSLRSRSFLRGDIVLSNLLLVVLYCIIRTADLEAYRWPILMIALFAGVFFLQIVALMLSLPPRFMPHRNEGIRAGLALLILVALGGLLLIRPSQERAVERGGGLLQPKLFQFDFSQILRLESEISMNDDLVLIVRKDAEDTHVLLRRFVLSGYNQKQGFYRHETIDEAAHPAQLPNRRTVFEAPGIDAFGITNQEYFLVNFDSSAFIGMKEPVEIVPFESWDASSFNSAYAVQSHTSEALPFELIDSAAGEPGPETFGLGAEEYAFYTQYGNDRRIADFAGEIAGDLSTPWEKVQAVYERLKYGEYRYSLKPGIAPDGDQLGYFLFDAKKGYCSYFAFSMTLLLRSLGIPARVAVGFFVDPVMNTFNYYPVLSNMAHAWVEVYYPRYGWIEYDPTTVALAADEEFTFSTGVPRDLFERLMKEILENRSRLTPKEGRDDAAEPSVFANLRVRTGRFLRENWLPLLAAVLCAFFIVIRCGLLFAALLPGKIRKRAVRLWMHTLRRLSLGGLRRGHLSGEAEWARHLEKDYGLPVYALYHGAAAARYAPEYTREQFGEMKTRYRIFSEEYKKTVAPPRRLLAWLLPPLALVLAARKTKGPGKGPGAPGGGKNTAARLLMILLLLPLVSGRALIGQEASDEAGILYNEARRAEQSELWEQAIELYSRGSERYPADSRFPWALGNLYYSRRLYGLAWEEYRKVEALMPGNTEVLYRLSRTAGYLNRDALSAEYLERILAINPDSREAIGSLGWMYYKLHRLIEGERLLLSALNRFGDDTDYAMTLGTVYSEMFRYDDAKAFYLKAIEGGEELGDREFTAVAHYNLSILESRFYKYAEAFDRTNLSLSSQNRASGRLSRGELYLRRLELTRTLAEYQAAYEIDTSPLSKLNLAQAYQLSGRLEEARLYAEDCLKSSDNSWMLNYGIDPDRYKRDIHDILYKTYTGLAKTEKRMVYGTLSEWIKGLVRRCHYHLKAASHHRLFRKYCLAAAAAFETDPADAGAQQLDALIQYYNAFEPYPRRALSYLRRARDIEIPLIPRAEASYIAEEGMLLRNAELLRQAIPRLDPVWERDTIARSYAKIALHAGGKNRRGEKRDAAERLYALNRGALRQEGIPLPAELFLDCSAAPKAGRAERIIRRTLRKMGIELMPKNSITVASDSAAEASVPYRFKLRITLQGGEGGQSAACELYDGGRGTSVYRKTVPLGFLSAADIGAFAKVLGDGLFCVN